MVWALEEDGHPAKYSVDILEWLAADVQGEKPWLCTVESVVSEDAAAVEVEEEVSIK